MMEIRGTREGRQALTRTVRRGFSRQVDGLDLRMRSEISEMEGSRKEEKEWVGRRDSGKIIVESLPCQLPHLEEV